MIYLILVLKIIAVPVILVGAFFLGMVLFVQIYNPLYARGSSMKPNIEDGDFILCRKISIVHKFKLNHIYCYHPPDNSERFVIKRLNKILDDGRLYFLGDNRSNSSDSRNYGAVDRRAVKYIYMKKLSKKDAKTNRAPERVFSFLEKLVTEGKIEKINTGEAEVKFEKYRKKKRRKNRKNKR